MIKRRAFLKWMAAVPLLGLGDLVPMRGRGSHTMFISIEGPDKDTEEVRKHMILDAERILLLRMGKKFGPGSSICCPWKAFGYQFYTPEEARLVSEVWSYGPSPFLKESLWLYRSYETTGWYEGKWEAKRVS